MNEGVRTVLYPVRDLAKAKQLFTDLLGVKPIADGSNYVGFQLAGQDIGLVPVSPTQVQDGPVAYFHVDDIHQRLEALLKAGAVIHDALRDVGYGKLAALVQDPHGNLTGLIQMP
jgi:predicted enzyme related to lactoylglutathione lyase